MLFLYDVSICFEAQFIINDKFNIYSSEYFKPLHFRYKQQELHLNIIIKNILDEN